MRLSRQDTAQLLRGVGGVFITTGALLLLLRQPGGHLSSFGRLLVLLIPAVTLGWLALAPGSRSDAENARPAQALLLVLAIPLGLASLIELLSLLGVSNPEALLLAAILALTAALAGYGARRTGTPYAALLCGLALLASWLLLWAQILGTPSAGTIRWLLLVAAVALLTLAAVLANAQAIGAREMATVGGLAAVLAGVLGVVVGLFAGLANGIQNLLGTLQSQHGSTTHGLADRLAIHTNGLQSLSWDVYLLTVSTLLIVLAARARIRGLGYVAALGLVGFLVSVGAQVTQIESGRSPASGLSGWSVALLVIGVAGLSAPALQRGRDQAG